VSVDEFHTANAERAATRPHSMLATATHDHKRGEDTRIRIDTLTEFAGAWGRALRRWARLNRTKLADVRGFPAPSPFDEYHLYQELIGTWPPEWTDPGVPDDDAYAAYIERICAYMLKATREAKMRTSWQQPNEGYEAATDAFIRGILERGDDARFPAELAAFVAMIQPAAMVSSIAQVVLKCTSPGIPDVYQGCELWDHSLVDPDNRRPVDFAARAAMLAASIADPAGARGSWVDGRVKLFVLAKLMRLRADARATFIEGDYVPLEISGAGADRAVAFQRAGTVVVVPRLAASIVEPSADGPRVVFRDERVLLANPAAGYRELFTGRTIVPDADGSLAMSDLLGPFPVAVLTPE
jgi:(1->4)-alpha-D-glucan 1-alpha-D-glucosylmutase